MNGKDYVPYESNHRLRKLLLVMTIVNHGQGQAISSLCLDNEAYFAIVEYGKGTAPNEFYAFSSAIPKKEVVIAVLREDKWPVYKSQLKERFSVSEMAKGMAFAIPIDAVSGVSIYKMLSNTRVFEKPVHQNKKEEKHG